MNYLNKMPGSLSGLLLRIVPAAALVGSLILAGCSKNDSIVDPGGDQAPAGVTSEESAMKYYATNDEFASNSDVTMNDGDTQAAEPGLLGSLSGDLTPLRFGRIIRSITRNVVIDHPPGDSIAVATVTKDIEGIFRIRAVNDSSDTVTVDKEFHDQSQMKIVFRRMNRDTLHYWRNWVPVGASLVSGGTVPPNNLIAIRKVEAYLPNGDTVVVTDPLNTIFRYRWRDLLGSFVPGFLHFYRSPVPELADGQQLTMRVTVQSSSADTDLVALRFGCDFLHRNRARMELVSEVNNGDGTFTRVYERMWTVPPYQGFFNVAVDAMTHGTLFSSTEPYAVSWWGVPYRVF